MTHDGFLPEPSFQDERPRGFGEPIVSFLTRSTMPFAVNLRAWINDSLLLAPESARADLLGRLRSTDDKHRSAFWELACARALTALGFELFWHPPLPNDENTKRPDWLVSRTGTPAFYFEARVLEEDEDVDDARIADELNKVKSDDFWITHVYVASRGDRTVSYGRFRRAVQSYIAGLTWHPPDELPPHNLLTSRRAGSTKSNSFQVWKHDGWAVEFDVQPKPASRRGNPLDRPVRSYMGRPIKCTVAEQLKRQVGKKIRKYGRLNLPLVVGVHVVDNIHNDEEILNGLLGTRVYVPGPAFNDGKWGRKRDGLIQGESGLQARRLSALLVASRLNLIASEPSRVRVWFHPDPYHPLDPAHLPLPSTKLDLTTDRKIEQEGLVEWDDLVRSSIRRTPG